MLIDVRADIAAATRSLNEIERKQIPFATALAMTKTAFQARDDLKAEAKRVFNRPTPFTVNSVFAKQATKDKMEYRVFLRDEAFKGTPAATYLQPQIHGGSRKAKRFEEALQRAGVLRRGRLAVPGRGARLNTYGNQTPGQLTQILSQLRANPDPLQNASGSARSRRKRRAAQYFLFGPPGSPRGVLQRAGKDVSPVLVFVDHARYQVRYRFYDVAQRTVQRLFATQFERALARALATAR